MDAKHFISRLSVLLALCAIIFTSTSCGDDEVVIPVVEGINVADGFYMAKIGTDTTTTTTDVLTAESVEDDGFSSQTRAGFVANYIWMEGGTYILAEIANKEIVKTLGGTATTETDMGSGCNFNDYDVVALTDGGAGFSVSAGLYKVTYDAMTSEMIIYKIETPGIIGSATPGGWGSDTQLTGSVDANGGSWSVSDVILREGEYKLRFNCRWNLDRRIDPAAGFDPSNGYQLFTNFGGSAADPLPGNDGSNIPIAESEEGIYTIDATWSGKDGWAITLTKTGDAPVITFTPDDHQWALTGDATPNGWADDDPSNDPVGVDHDMNYEGFDMGTNTYTWKLASIDLVEGGFKFRANDKWDENMGWEAKLTLTGDTGDFSDDGGNIKVGAAGTYEIILTTSDDGDTYTAAFTKM